MAMKIEIELSSYDVTETMKLIREYINNPTSDIDIESLNRVDEALGEADRIVIQQEGTATWKNT